MAIKPNVEQKTAKPKKRSTKKTTNSITKAQLKKLSLDDEIVAQYLIQNPQFFIRNATHIEQMHIPHPIRGVISLSEWQLTRQRNKIKQLETEITLLMEQARGNERLFDSLMSILYQLLQASDLNDMVERLNLWAKSIGLMGAYLYLFEQKWQLGAPLDYHRFALSADKFEFIRVRHLQYSNHYLGTLNMTECHALMPEKSCFGSVAMSLFGQFADLGVIIFASRNPAHYQEGQGTFLLDKISQALPLLINRWVMRKS